MTVRRAFVDGPFGQIHLRMTAPIPGATPLVCLHATAYSSQSFLPLMEAFGGRRQVIAIDAPGYGDSTASAVPIDIAGYAEAIAVAIQGVTEQPVAVLGYHTGAYIAAELAISHAPLVERLILIGVPYFQALDIEAWRKRLVVKHQLEERLDQFAERWDYFVAHRHPSVSLERSFANFVDEMKVWPNGWWAHEAMFGYDSDTRLPLVRTPVLMLNPAGHLAPASRAAAELLYDATVVEMPDLSGPVLETAPDRLADEIEAWLTAGLGATSPSRAARRLAPTSHLPVR